MSEKGYEFLEHISDVQIRCWGPNLKEAFSQAALGLFDTITEIKNVKKKLSKSIKITSEDKESLLFDFLSELLYLFDTEELVFSDIEVFTIKEEAGDFLLEASLKGDVFNPEKHSIGTEVKAITYSYMKIEELEDKIVIEVILDI
jgi:SHS2 domain-containing protein